MSRESLVEAVVKTARNLGWQTVEVDDTGTSVTLLVSAPGATEQLVEGHLHDIVKQLKDLGGPENYPATEEYDMVITLDPKAQMKADAQSEAEAEEAYIEAQDTISPEVHEAAEAAMKDDTSDDEADPTPQAELAAEVAEIDGPAPAENTPTNDTSTQEDTAAVQVGRVVFVVRANGAEVARSVYEDKAVRIAKNRRSRGDDVHLFKMPINGHISTALARPVGERHSG